MEFGSCLPPACVLISILLVLCLNFFPSATEIRGQLRRYLDRYKPKGAAVASCCEDTEALRKCIVSGFFFNSGPFHCSIEAALIARSHRVYCDATPIRPPPSALSDTTSVPFFSVLQRG